MAGGRGERFWPLSRENKPKQFLSLTNDSRTMIQLAFDRLLPLVSPENIYVVTNENYKSLTQEQLPNMPAENILCEPMGRNTAPCIAFAAAVISAKHEDSVMLVLPSDHMISDENLFFETLKKAVSVAESGENLVTIGIAPTKPETGYGYINFSGDRVLRFVEKPALSLAKEYLASGDYLWNSGMFIWKTSTIISNIERFLPAVYQGFLKIRESVGAASFTDTLKSCFENFESVSVDYGIMEKADNIYAIRGDFGWNDVGSWTAIDDICDKNEHGNIVKGDAVTVNTRDSIIIGGKKLIATVGIDNIIVVDTDDAILICAKECAQDVKKVVEKLNG
jgi:mannose-1-phosphate guanylyltransferase